jgi:hypothetical protein
MQHFVRVSPCKGMDMALFVLHERSMHGSGSEGATMEIPGIPVEDGLG